jgi:hypothetical protein
MQRHASLVTASSWDILTLGACNLRLKEDTKRAPMLNRLFLLFFE